VINILAADKLLNAPRLYATFLLWLLSELYESLPEVGDLPAPKMVFFFDEAHLLFKDAPKVLLERIELIVRLSRSKGVGVYFVTQNPLDIPDSVLGQLGNRVQHALRAFTPRDQKAVQTAASTMRPNPGLDISAAITELAVGEALVSLLDAKGTPCPTERVFVQPPASLIGPIDAAQRQDLLKNSLVAGVYEQAEDRESAYEILLQRAGSGHEAGSSRGSAGALQGTLGQAQKSEAPADDGLLGKAGSMLKEALIGRTGARGGQYDGLVQQIIKGEARRVGRDLLRGVLGGLLGSKKR
jgi:hypothetical protein